MKWLGLNKRLLWLNLIYNRLCDYLTGNMISMSFYKTVNEELEKFDEHRWYSNSHTGLIA